MIEAELKARLKNPDSVQAQLGQLAAEATALYLDAYFDTSDGALDATGRELRVRTVLSGGDQWHILTFKEPAVDAESQSKPEREVTIDDPVAARAILRALGYPVVLEFSKQCVNYRLERDGREFLATLVRVPEIDGTFLEVETLTAAREDLAAALAAVRGLLAELGVGDDELTTDTYTDAVVAARS